MILVYREGRFQLLEKLFCKVENLSFVIKFDVWLRKNSRGGLLRLIDSFYLFVRELEIVIRKISDYSYSYISCKVKEFMMEFFMVNYYLKQLFGENLERDLLLFLEDIICVFLIVRGFVIVRVFRNKFSGRISKQSDSLRQVLKLKNNN